MEKFDKFTGKDIVADERAEKAVVDVAVALILTATLGVASWQLLGNANYTGVDSTTKTLVQTVVGVIAAIAIVLIILRYAKK